MDKRRLTANSTGDRTMGKQVLVTITPYNEQEKRMLNGTSSATTTTTTTTTSTTSTGAPVPPPAPPPLPFPSKNRGSDDSVEMQSIESFKLKETPNPPVPKPPSTYFPMTNPSAASNGSPRHIGTGGGKPPVSNGKDAATSPVAELAKTSPSSVSPTNGAQSAKSAVGGKVAIRIGAYEGETKQPSRLEFLSQQTRDKNGVDDTPSNGPVVSRLQNELVATLQRSNLRRKTEGENQSPVKTIPENVITSSNDTTNSEPSKHFQGSVEKLASALNNKVTIKVNPENGSR